MLDTIAHILISPINQSLLGIGFGISLLFLTNIRSWIGKCLIWFSLTWLLLCSQYFFSYWLIAPLEKAFPPIQAQSKQWQNSEAIWVLACYHFDAESLPLGSQFNHCSLERLVQAANMYRIKPMPIYLTGGNFNLDSELNHANQAKKLLLALGVNEHDIMTINKGQNTVSEAKALAIKINNKKIAVVSSATHGIRISKILLRSGINFIFIPVHFAAKEDPKYAGANCKSDYKLFEDNTSSIIGCYQVRS
jgi:uncharacterized SAM-binding protein YcdF (DUF218 family)